MDNEVVLLESRTLRGSLRERTEALEKVKALHLLPDGVHVTKEMVADYFEVDPEAVKSLARRHREELRESGMVVLNGADLETFLGVNMTPRKIPGRGLLVFPRRAVLNVAMLLRDSTVAREVRRSLLDLADRGRDAGGWPEAMVAQVVERVTVVIRAELRQLIEGQELLCERVRVLEAKVERDREVIAGMSALLARTGCEVRTLGGRVDLLCTVSATPGRGRRRR